MFGHLQTAWTDGRESIDQLAAEAIQRESQASKSADFSTIKIPAEIGTGNESAAAFHAFKSFAGALVEDQRINDALKESLTKALKNGQSFEDWRETIDQQFDKLGVTRFSNYRLNLIYRTESALSYAGAQYARAQELKDKFPYWEYSAILDQRTRPSHRALDGKYFAIDNPEFWPPLGFNCRCTIILISKAEALRKGIKVDKITPQMRANLQNAEFIGDKNHSYNLWLKEQQKAMSQAALNLLQQAFEDLLNTLQNLTENA